MKAKKFWDVWDNLELSNKMLQRIIFFLLAVTIINSITILKLATRKKEVLVIPGAIGRMNIEPGELPDAAVENFALYLIDLYASFNPESFQERMHELMEYVEPSQFTQLKKEELSSIRRVQKAAFSQSYVADEFKLRKVKNAYEVSIIGTITQFVGDKVVLNERRRYEMRLAKKYPTERNPLGLVLAYLEFSKENSR